MKRKLKILFPTEFTSLNTGYATYSCELMRELYKTDKYDLTELACYCRTDDPRHVEMMKNIPWKVLPVITPDEPGWNEQQYLQTPTAEFGSLKFEQACLEVQPDIIASITDPWMNMYLDQSPFRRLFKTVIMPTVDACFVAGTPVITEYGVKNIEDIKEGEKIVSHDGSINRVYNTSIRSHNDILVKIEANGPVLPTIITPEHPVLVVKYKGQKWTHTSRRHRSVNHNYKNAEFISAKDVEPGDYLVIPKQNTFENLDHIYIENYLEGVEYKECSHGLYTKYNYTTSNNIKNKILITEQLAGFLGLYVSEGSVNEPMYAMRISMCKSKEQEYLDFAQEFIKNTFNIKTRRYIKESDCEEVGWCSKILGCFFKNSCGKEAYTKQIPDFILKSNPKIAVAFLEKLFVGDGCDTNTPHNKREISYSTASRTLAYQVCGLLLQLGILSSLNKHKNAYKISLLNYNGEKIAGLFDWKNKNFEFSKFNNTKSWIDKETGHALVRVSKISKEILDDPIPVYNLSVEDKETYSVGFAVHNCKQQAEWLDFYQRTDAILSYTEFGDNTLRSESGNTINLYGTASPAVDINTFKFIQNKVAHKEKIGMRGDSIIIGMVARNQRRKLFPALMDSFVDFLNKLDLENTENVFLYLHTAHPDLGWNIPQLIKEHGLSHKVLFTFKCRNCQFAFPQFYRDVKMICPRCRMVGSTSFANSQDGITRQELADTYSLMDLYVQYVSNEGFGIPLVEAAACGIPVCGTDYSGVESILKNVGGKAISASFYTEVETGRSLAIPDNTVLSEYITEFVNLPASTRLIMGYNTHTKTVARYGSWKSVADKWMNVFDQIEIAETNQWLSTPLDFIPLESLPPCPEPNRLTDEQFVIWCLTDILRRPDWATTHIGLKMIRDLIYGTTSKNNLGFMSNDSSLLGSRANWNYITRNDMYEHVKGMRNRINSWEMARHQKIQL